jgi:hypothetical protein
MSRPSVSGRAYLGSRRAWDHGDPQALELVRPGPAAG